MVRRIILGLALTLALCAPALADDPYARKRTIDDRLADVRDRIAAADAREQALTAQISGVTRQIRTLERRVGDVSQRLSVLEHDLALHRRKLARLRSLFALQTRRLRFLRVQYRVAVRRLNRRLVDIYVSEPPTTIAVLLSARSFSDVLEQLEYLRHVASQDRRIAEEVGEAKAEVRTARARTGRTRAAVASAARAIAIRAEQQRALRGRLVSSRGRLRTVRLAKRETLVAVEETERRHRGEAEALAQVSGQLAAQIRAAQAAARARAAAEASGSSPSPTAEAGQPSSTGALIWPVSGAVTSPFGMRWGRMHEGIDIAAPAGAPIVAAASGIVISSGWMGGYGNLVVIDHGGGLATAYAHNSSNAVAAGQHVVRGQTVAYVGCTGHCFGSHLHFEVRVNGVPVDPLGYL